MNQLDTYYRALLDYKKYLSTDRESESLLRAISAAESSTENITVRRNICTVDEDWVLAIEEGLVHIEKALKEERQFILSQGEVVPIEKAKNVSTESIKHLAKHSNLITREQKGDDIIPDSLYTVERLNDYTVYENRFLYMLLCYLRDFIAIRQDKIVELTYKYAGSASLHKILTHGKRSLSYSLEFKEENRDDPYLHEHNPAREMIDRISLLLKTVLSFLDTPLMEEASKVPMLKPPITKTNVLKMDKHFKGAVALYDYIMAYDKLGYSVEEKAEIISPFGRDLSNDFAGICAAISFITYEYGLDMREELLRRYKTEEERRRAAELDHHKEEILSIKRRMINDDISSEEYIVALEKHVKSLEEAYVRMERLSELIGETEAEKRALSKENNSLKIREKELEDEIFEQSQRHHMETESLKRECEERISSASEAYAKDLNDAKSKHEQDLRLIKNECVEKLTRLNAELDSTVTERDNIRSAYKELIEEKRLSEAMLKAMKAEKGMLEGDFSDKKSFDELEQEYAALTRFYNQQWRKAKKDIRKNLLSFKALKNQKDNHDEQE